jgi:hypothetical protein
MHFEGPATRWLQYVDHRVKVASWIELCSWIHDRFGRDQHELFIRQLYKIKEVGSVQEYIDKFCELVDQLQAYSPNIDPLYYTTRFVDGLKDYIKFLISVQRPKDLDTGCCLALLQEETSSSQGRTHKSVEGGILQKSTFKEAFPLPRPPLQPKSENVSEDKPKAATPKQQSMEDKLVAYRMAKGLCRKCGEKWSKGRRCAASVQLNIIQEVWDLIDPDHSDLQESNPKDSQLFMVLSVAALDGIEAPRTLKITRLIQGVEILILVDSGSSHSFISEEVATSVTPAQAQIKVKVANGNILHS